MQDCFVRIPGVCNYNPETVVLAHLNGGGMGMKVNDIFGAFCCSDCHDVLDGRKYSRFDGNSRKFFHMEGIVRTQQWWIENGYIKAVDGRGK